MKQYITIFILSTFTTNLFLKELCDEDLQNYIGYKSSTPVNPFSLKDKIVVKDIQNYSPVKFLILNNPHIQIKKVETKRKRNLKIEENKNKNSDFNNKNSKTGFKKNKN